MFKSIIKRVFDAIMCSLALVCLFPIFIITAIGIKISSPGPIFYYSVRKGRKGRKFNFYKFRSMHLTDCDKHMCVADAERLFSFGKFIRKTKIDELPQLVNVIKGDMSIVGPRPMPVASKMYDGEFAEIQKIRPGLTSPASLYDYIVGDKYTDNELYKKEVYPIKQKLELYYTRNRNLLYDLKLIVRTIILIIAVSLGKKNFSEIPELAKIND